jgi:hypothetical protein
MIPLRPGPAFQEYTGSCHENVPAPVLFGLQSTDGLTVLAQIKIVAILVYYQPFYNTSHTMKSSGPLLLANVPLHCRMYPSGKVDISWHLAIPVFPQSDSVGKPIADIGSMCNEAKQTTWPQVILKFQPPICLDYRSLQVSQHVSTGFDISIVEI